ncbi:MAG: putative inner membrane protein [Rhodocyclaceae bacterium]|nr:MAG: putative inner membrane protein [Rhodocyclaceae bacterium]TND05657.1 MAG: putative inner membrane protein [Rhodocyclaceae bacterium]
MDFSFTAEAGLAGLFLASFLSATLLPGGSEVVLFAVIKQHPDQVMAALLLATLGNTLGGMTTYGMARLLPGKVGADDTVMKRLDALRKHGAPLLLLAWAPVIGDALCAAAGWLRLPAVACAAWMAAGKAARYVLVVAGAGMA